MRALTPFTEIHNYRSFVSNNEALAREGIDTISYAFAMHNFCIERNNEALAREGIDTIHGDP